MADYLHTNGFTYSEQEVMEEAKKNNQTLEDFLADTPELSLVGKQPGATEDDATVVPQQSLVTELASADGSSDSQRQLLEINTNLPTKEELEEQPFSISQLIQDVPTRQDNNIAIINQNIALRDKLEPELEIKFQKFQEEHNRDNADDVIVDKYGSSVFIEKFDSRQPYLLPKDPEGFLLNDYKWNRTQDWEGARNVYINRKADEQRQKLEAKYYQEGEMDSVIVSQGDNYVSLDDMDIVEAERDGNTELANRLRKEKNYVELFKEDGSFKNWIPKEIEIKSQNLGQSTDKDGLLELRKQKYFNLLATLNLAHEHNQDNIDPYLKTLGDIGDLSVKSLIHKIRNKFGDEASIDNVMSKIEEAYNTGELPAGLHKLPSKTATARAYNNALEEFVVINRALEVNADLSKLKEEQFFKEIVAPTNDKVVETFSGMMKVNGYEMSPDAIKRPGFRESTESTEFRNVLEGARDVATHLVPLVASVWLTKKLPAGIGKKAPNLGQVIDQKTNILGRYLKGAGPHSRIYKSGIDLTLGGIKEVGVLAAAEVPLTKVFGQDPFVYNPKTGDIQAVFPFALGFGNVAAAKILNKLNTTKNVFTPMLSTIERSKTAQALLEANIGATTGTATMFFAEQVTKGVQNWSQLGYDSEEDMKTDHGFKTLVETYIGMLMFQSVSPAFKQNALTKLGSGMRHDIMRATTGLTPRAKKAMKFFGIERNKNNEFNLADIKNAEGQKIFEVSQNKSLDAEGKKIEIEKIKNQAEELVFHNELKLAKKLAKEHGTYRQNLENTFDIANKLKSGQKPTAKDIDRFSKLSDVELKFLKQRFGVTEGSEFSRMLDNKRDVYKNIIQRVDNPYLTKDGKLTGRMFDISPEARSRQIELYLKEAEFAGEIQMLTKEAEKSPHLKEVNNEKIKKIKEKSKLNSQEIVKNEELYDKILKDKFQTEVEFSKLMAKEMGVGFNILGSEQYNKVKGAKKGAEGHYDRVRNQIYINKDAALKVRQLGTPLHEITHAILKNSLKETYIDADGVERTRVSKEGMIKINQFRNLLTPKERAAVEKRIEQSYKYYRDSRGNFILKNGKKIAKPENQYFEEYLTAFGDVLKNKEVVESKELAGRISEFFAPMLRRAGFKNLQVTTKDGQGLYNMIKAIQKSSETQTIDRDVLNILKKSKEVTGKEITESRTVTKQMEQASAEIDKIYNEKGVGGYNEIIDRVRGKNSQGEQVSKDFIDMYTKLYETHPNYRYKDLYDAIANDPVYGVLGSIVKYDPARGTTMAEHILGRLKQGKHIDVANKILGKDAERVFTKKLDAPEVKEIATKELSAEDLVDIQLAKEKIEKAPNFRKSIVKGEEKGINQELINKIESAVLKTFGTKIPLPGTKGFKNKLQDSYKTELKKPIADLMGKGPEYEVFLRENFESIMKFIDKSFFVQMERLTPRKDRIFTEVEIENMSTKQTDKAIAEGRVPKNTSRTAGNTLYKFKKPTPAQFIKFYTPPTEVISKKTGKLVKSGLKGTRKDRLAEVIGIELAKDMTSEVISRPEVIAKIKDISLLQLEGSIDVVGKTPSGKITEARKDLFDNYVTRVANEIGRDPNQMFSLTRFEKEVKKLQLLVEKSQSIEDVFDLNTGRPLKGDYLELSSAVVLNGWGEGYVRTAVNKVGGNKGKGYEFVTGTQAVKAAKTIAGLKAELNLTERKILLEEIGNFKGGKVQAPDLMVGIYNRRMSWELKYGDAVAGKNNAGFINYTERTFERKQQRELPEHEQLVRQAIQEAINNVAPLEAKLRELGVLQPGEAFTTKTKIPLAEHNIVSGKGNEKGLVSSISVKVNGDFIAGYYNGKGVFYLQMNKKGAMYLGSDPFNIAKELGIAKLEGEFTLKARIYAQSYKATSGPYARNAKGEIITDKNGKPVYPTAGYTYKIIAEPIITPKSITSKSTFSLDAPGAWNRIMNTKSVQAMAKTNKPETVALKKNNKNNKGVISESRTNKEYIDKAKIVDKALEFGRVINKKKKGMSTFDFDETLIDKGKNFIVAIEPNTGKKVKISSSNWPTEGPKFSEQGYTFDFKDFVKVRGGVEGPMFKKFKERIAKFGPENVFILTARPPEAATAIFGWLKSKGVEIPFKNITGLGNSTGQAKAEWMLKKFSEGYNDMYFVDDALPNVKAVKEVLSQLDIKSKVQQAYSQTNINLNKEVNKIIEHSLDIGANKTFSKAEAKTRGKDIKRRRLFIPDSAADLELLLEPLYGKGKQGSKNQKWFQNNFIRHWERGINDYNTAKQTATNEYMELRKRNKDVVKLLDKQVEGTSFSNDMAMRVYLWNKAGFKIPDLAKTTETKLVNHIKNNPKLREYAESFAKITKQEKELKEPSTEWWAETLAGEINDIGRGVSRKKYIKDFIEIKNEIFSEANLNKMESKLGSNWRWNIEEMLDRMETGRTRSSKMGKYGNEVMNYLNGSVGTIMNLNTRSATLQLISTVNFLNYAENNPLAAAKAFANQPQYWKDFMLIMNSDMLRQRRAGLKINVTEAELASIADVKNKGSIGAMRRVIAWTLKKGYLPTKIADSFAISAGGATYYRNRINKYKKEGLSTKEAEKKAFVDFQAIAERTQQSSRADLLSNQQTSFAGRLILPFANTPMQMNRIMMKNYLDLKNGRYKGSFGENSFTDKMSQVAYYGFVQSLIFAGLQSGLFAMMANTEDVEEASVVEKRARAINTISDSFLRGMGIGGAVLSGLKNATQTFIKENEKGFKADYSEVAEALLNISPTIGSKYGKLDAAGNTYKFNKKEIQAKGFELGGPSMQAAALTTEALTNIPVNRVLRKTENIQGALDSQYESWQRLLMILGWSKWDVGITPPKKEKETKKEKPPKFISKPTGKSSKQSKFILN